MKKSDMDKLTAIKRMVELSIVDLQNIIDGSEKRLSIIEKRIDEYDLKDNLTDIQEERLDQWREEFDELEDEIDQLTDIKTAFEDVVDDLYFGYEATADNISKTQELLRAAGIMD